MFSSIRISILTVTRPSIVTNLAPCFKQTRTHHSRNVINFCKWSSRSNTICCNVTTSHKKVPQSILACCRWLSTQHSQLSAETKRSTDSLAAGGAGHVKSRPVRTDNVVKDPRERSRVQSSTTDSSGDDDCLVNGSKNNFCGEERHRSDIMNSYEKAKERVQEGIDMVKESKENILTIPNMLTTLRIALSPVLGYLVIQEYYTLSASLFLFTSATDVLDGWIARKFPSQMSVLGSIIDPLADKVLITILTVSLTISELIPVPLAFIILGRDVGLITSVFWLRYKTLTPPRTLSRYFDMTHHTVRLQPTTISKYNTLIQVALVGFTLGAPVFNYVDHVLLHGLWYVTATSTVLSGLSYVFFNNTYKIVKKGK